MRALLRLVTATDSALLIGSLATASAIADGVDYAFAIFDVNGWLGHNGDILGAKPPQLFED